MTMMFCSFPHEDILNRIGFFSLGGKMTAGTR